MQALNAPCVISLTLGPHYKKTPVVAVVEKFFPVAHRT